MEVYKVYPGILKNPPSLARSLDRSPARSLSRSVARSIARLIQVRLFNLIHRPHRRRHRTLMFASAIVEVCERLPRNTTLRGWYTQNRILTHKAITTNRKSALEKTWRRSSEKLSDTFSVTWVPTCCTMLVTRPKHSAGLLPSKHSAGGCGRP